MFAVFAIAPVLMGVLLLDYLTRRTDRNPGFRVVTLCLGAGVGFGICSLIYFIWALLGKPLAHGFLFIEVGCLLGLTLGYIFTRRDCTVSTESHHYPAPQSSIPWVLRCGFYVVLGFALARFSGLSLQNPHGYVDAWVIYNLRAKFLLQANLSWHNAFSDLLAFSHPDYPLLIPANVARGWEYVGENTVFVPILIAMIFTFVTAGLLMSAVTVVRTSLAQGYLAGLVLLSGLSFIEIGTYQYADVPFAFFCLATIVLFALYDSSSGADKSFLVIAGLTAGFGTWAKNEGWLFLLSIACARFISIALYSHIKQVLREGLFFALGLVPVIVVVVYFKLYIAPANDLVSSQQVQHVLPRLMDISRYFQVGGQFLQQLMRLGDWPVPTLALLFCNLIFLGLRVEEKQKQSIATGAITVVLILIGYFFTYIVSPHPLSYHLDTSLSRVLQHLWPSLLFVYFLVVRVPDVATEYIQRLKPKTA